MAWVFLYAFVADALCARGDEYLRAGDPQAAERYYARALAIDPDSEGAVDRFAFAALEIRTTRELVAEIDTTSAYLTRHPSRWQIRLDRALALFAIGRNPEAALDLREVGRSIGDGRYLKLAAIVSQRSAHEGR